MSGSPRTIRGSGSTARRAPQPLRRRTLLYPSFGRPVAEAEYQAFLGVAREVVRWAEQRVAELLG